MFHRSSGAPLMNQADPLSARIDAVGLHGLEDDLGLGREAADVEARVEAEALAHRRVLAAGER